MSASEELATWFQSSTLRSIRKLLSRSLLLIGCLTFSGYANASSVVQVDALGKTWDVSYVYGTFDDYSSLIQSQPWWIGSCATDPGQPECFPSIAFDFIDKAVTAGIDFPNVGGAPWFTDAYAVAPFFAKWGDGVIAVVAYSTYNGGNLDGHVGVWHESPTYWAVATEHAVPEPSSLALFFGALGVLYARRRFGHSNVLAG